MPIDYSDEQEQDTCESCLETTAACRCFRCESCRRLLDSWAYTLCDVCGYCEECCTCWFCDRCRQRHLDGEDCPEPPLLPYSARVPSRFGFFPSQEKVKQPFLYLGVELETELREDCSAYDLVQDLESLDEYRSWAIAKEDGSLKRGAEIVSAPSSLEEHKKRWPKILRVMRNTTESWNPRSTGMHVHINRRCFTPLSLSKFVYFVNAPETRPWIVSLAGRTSLDYARIKKKLFRKEGSDYVLYAGSRYEAVNLTNEDTVEVRIFKGTLNECHVLANIEFVHALVEYMRDCSVQDCADWSKFMGYVRRHKKLYGHLIKYMDSIDYKIARYIAREKQNNQDHESEDSQDREVE